MLLTHHLRCAAGVMLERNCVVFCPNVGLLSTCVLSLIPLLRPFSWQHFLMPVLPDTQHWLTFLDSPTPFVVGIQVCSLIYGMLLAAKRWLHVLPPWPTFVNLCLQAAPVIPDTQH